MHVHPAHFARWMLLLLDTSHAASAHNIRFDPGDALSLPIPALANQKPVASRPFHAFLLLKLPAHRHYMLPANEPALCLAFLLVVMFSLYALLFHLEISTLLSANLAVLSFSDTHHCSAVCD